MVAMNQIPATLLVPFVAAEFDATQAQQGPALLAYRGLIIGQKLSSGTAAADSLVRAPNIGAAIAAGGRGSSLHREAIGWFASNQGTEVWLGVLGDPSSGVAATATILFTAAATGAGTITFYFGGIPISVGVNAADATTVLATNTAAAINANGDLPITATAANSTVTIAFRHKGTIGNTYDIRVGFNGELLPAGVAMTITAMSGGTGVPPLANLIAAMSDLWFQIWAHPYTDPVSLKAIEDELAARFGPLRATSGVAVSSASGTFSTLATLGTGRNSPHSMIIAQPGASPLTPPMEFAAEAAAIIAQYGAQDPARGFTTLAMRNAIATAETDQFDLTERNLLLTDGIATSIRAAGGVVQLERMVTTYQFNAAGQPDAAYRDVTTPLTLLYMRHSFRVMMSAFAQYKLADDGTRLDGDQSVMTPKFGRALALTWFRDLERRGLVENYDAFKANLIVERSRADPNRLDFLLPPNLVNQLIVTAARIRFGL